MAVGLVVPRVPDGLASVQQLPRMQRSNAKLVAAVETYLTELRRVRPVWRRDRRGGEVGALAIELASIRATCGLASVAVFFGVRPVAVP